MADQTRDEYTIFHFPLRPVQPQRRGNGSRSALLRRVADSIDDLGDVQVQDITFHSEVTGDEDDLTMIVYYHRHPRRR